MMTYYVFGHFLVTIITNCLIFFKILGISPLLQSLCIRKLSNEGNGPSQFFFKYKSDWIYLNTLSALSDVTPDVNKVSVCLVSKIFNPEKYHTLIAILIEQYLTTGDPTKLLEGKFFLLRI